MKKRISFGELKLEIDTLGARITKFTKSGQEIMKTASDDLQGFNGMVLAPWPNRIADGKYQLGEDIYQLEINEADRNNALHGFAYKSEFEIIAEEDHKIVLQTMLNEPSGYPFEIELKLSYSLDSSGFKCECQATNNSDLPAPFGIAFHPYYPVEDQTKISIPAKTHILTNKQMIPVSEEPNPHRSFLFGEVDFDDCFSELERKDSIAKIQIDSGSQRLSLWQDAAFDYVMIYTTRTFESVEGIEKAIAIEAQSCPANAFITNPPLLAPGQIFFGSWGVETK